MTESENTTYGSAQGGGRAGDRRALTGQGQYTDDINEPGQAYAAILRSPIAHGEIRALDLEAAKAAPGVLAIYTGEDLRAAGLGDLKCTVPLAGEVYVGETPRPALAVGRARYAGEPVAALVAETLAQAEDAAELVFMDIEALAAVSEAGAALRAGAEAIWSGGPANLAYEWSAGDKDKTDAAFAGAAHVTRLTLENTRVVGNPMETRVALAKYDAASGRSTLIVSAQGVGGLRDSLAAHNLHIEPEMLRVITPDVGGGFGIKTPPYPEYVIVLHAAKALGRPVKWTGTRSEAFLSDNHGREGVSTGELALDEEGRFVGLRARLDTVIGAYYSAAGQVPSTRNYCSGLASVYTTPTIDLAIRGVFTNSQPIGPYRGAGRPEAVYLVERLVDEAARETGRDPAALRRLNMIDPGAMPYTTPLGLVYDSGEFAATMDEALRRADWEGFGARRRDSEAAGKLRGIGIGCFLEIAGGIMVESADIRFDADGMVAVRVASQPMGQGHATTFPALVARLLGVGVEKIRFIAGDSDEAPAGKVTVGSRSTVMVGSALSVTSDAIVAKGRALAGHFLEAAEIDIEFSEGIFRVAGTDRGIGIIELAAKALAADDLPEGLPDTLDSAEQFKGSEQSFPNGCHVCEVEIDQETGVVAVLRYTAVDDCGIVLNETVVDGQVHGGVAQGLGQVLGEHAIFDEYGQLLTGSFMDYFMPRADTIPALETGFHPTRCLTNPLGVKGVGEAGATGALPSAMNAVIDALSRRGIHRFDMPASPARVWRALSGGGGS
jgi:carbon-monoxide dehydrogenase large subunit